MGLLFLLENSNKGVFMANSKTFEIIFELFIFSIPFAFFLILTPFNLIFGSDSWYWLNVSEFPLPIFFNLLAILFWFSIIFLFSFVKGKNWLFIACLFLLNCFSLHFLEVEWKDYIMYWISFISIVFIKNKSEIYWKNNLLTRFFAIVLIVIIVLLHMVIRYEPFTIFAGKFNSPYLELQISPATIFLAFPSIFLFIFNRKWHDLMVLVVFWLIFMSGKFMIDYISIYLFACYLDFIGKKVFFPKEIIILLMIFLLIYSYSSIYFSFSHYLWATSSLCENGICNDKTDISLVHYFCFLGLKSQSMVYKCS